MKTAIIISDTHGNISAMEKVLPIMQESDYVFHLGDHQRDIELFERDIKGKIISVKGNCDGGGEEIFTEIEGVKIIAVHGDRYGVKSTPMKIYLRAKELGANVVFYGHTHIPLIEEIDGIKLVNPGAMNGYTEKSYCYAVFHQGKVTVKNVTFI